MKAPKIKITAKETTYLATGRPLRACSGCELLLLHPPFLPEKRTKPTEDHFIL
jgi:hypothetical protein